MLRSIKAEGLQFFTTTFQASSPTCYLSLDLLGGVRMVTDQSANVIARHDYAPFGQEISSGIGPWTSLWGASDNVNQKFTGQERDGETNLDFFQARYLSSGIGRFNSPDPGNAGADLTNPQSWNGYAYVFNNPLILTDPSGLCGGITAGISSDPYHGGGKALLMMAAQYGSDIAYPYAGDTKLGDIFKVATQRLGFTIGATNTAAAMIADVQAQSASSNSPSAFLSWSGGATSVQRAGIGANNSSVDQVLFSPGASSLPANNPNALLLSGSGLLDGVVNLTSGTSTGGTPGCGHDAACMWDINRNAINDLLLDHGNLGTVQSCPNPTVFLPNGVTMPLSSLMGNGTSTGSGGTKLGPGGSPPATGGIGISGGAGFWGLIFNGTPVVQSTITWVF